MSFPDRLARFNRYVTNPLMRTFAGRIPPFALVIHHGRKSGEEYRTPLWAFPSGDGITIALTYGSERDWVRNIMAEGHFTLVRRGSRFPLTEPTLIGERDGMAAMPRVLRPVLRMIGVKEFLRARHRDPEG